MRKPERLAGDPLRTTQHLAGDKRALDGVDVAADRCAGDRHDAG